MTASPWNGNPAEGLELLSAMGCADDAKTIMLVSLLQPAGLGDPPRCCRWCVVSSRNEPEVEGTVGCFIAQCHDGRVAVCDLGCQWNDASVAAAVATALDDCVALNASRLRNGDSVTGGIGVPSPMVEDLSASCVVHGVTLRRMFSTECLVHLAEWDIHAGRTFDGEIIVDVVTESDVDWLKELATAFNAELGFHNQSEAAHARVLSNVGKGLVVRLANSGQVVAMALVARATAAVASISHVYTRPEHRRKGYSRLVVSQLVSQLHREPWSRKQVQLYVDCDNAATQTMYRSIGFRTVGGEAIDEFFQLAL
jgi:ribosomal protein S18 acetylase RimI-like enzyme